ncbi:MAG: shikimate dehydrogenase [candidate division NC10 bacterium]
MSITGKTTVCVLLGDPVAHSASPRMQNAAFAALGLDWVYIPWAVHPKALPEALGALRGIENFGGANVTIPHKEAALEAMDELNSEARSIGAVNTIVPREGVLVGHNTDGEGFVTSLREEAGEDPRGKRVGLVGTGGGAKAVAYALARAAVAELCLFSRSEDRARSVLSHLRNLSRNIEVLALGLQQIQPDRLRRMDILINATPVGMEPSDPPLFDYGVLPDHLLVCDLIYRPPETPLLASARMRGCRILNGAGMLLYQGVRAFELWTGQKAPVLAMRQALTRGGEEALTGSGIGPV